MLNDQLYNALHAVFGTVIVESEGVTAEIERDYSSLYANRWRINENADRGEQYRVNCPFCRSNNSQKDTKHHLYISYLSYASPLIDGATLEQAPLLAHCFRRNCVQNPDNYRILDDMIAQGMLCSDGSQASVRLTAEQTNADDEPQYKTSETLSLEGLQTWVPDFHWCVEGMDPDIAEYLQQRNIDADIMMQFGLGWGIVKTPRTGTLLNNGVPWVIIPIVMNGKLRGVQARCPDKFITGDSLRYWIHPGMRKKAVVYNIDSARELGTGVVCEGVFDVFKVGAPGVCIFGHTPSVTQQTLLAGINKCLIWLPDTDPHADMDTVAEAREYVAQMNLNNHLEFGAHVVVLPAKDAGAMSRQDIWTEIVTQVPANVRDYLLNNVLERL